MLNSSFSPLCTVDLPWRGRQHYMHEVNLANPVMPEGFADYKGIVLDLARSAGHLFGVGYVTVDEKIVEAGRSQRRPGPHVDGYFQVEKSRWGHDGPGWNHTCNHLPVPRMAVIVAASVAGCMAWSGQFDARPDDNGDLSHIRDQLIDGELLAAGVGYLLSPDCVHESLIFDKPMQRTFLRIALKE